MKFDFNLFDESLIDRPQPWRLVHLLVAVGGVTLVAVSHWAWLDWERQKAERALAEAQQALARQKQMKAQIEAMMPDPKRVEALIADRERLSEELNAAVRLASRLRAEFAVAQRARASLLLEELATLHPDGVWLTEVQTRCCDAAGRLEGLRVAGNALAPQGVGEYLDRLAAAKSFRGLSFQKVQMEWQEEGRFWSFDLRSGEMGNGSAAGIRR
ncbi:MAG: PilN domain-containing protein [Hydrogenophilus sp.]|nr:PilN domain-containing protein [Hydrogenophilus sp.]